MAGQLAPGYITFTGALTGPQVVPAVVPASSIAVPNIVGLTEAQAIQTLQSLGFSVSTRPVQSQTGTVGNVLSQSPPAPTPSAPGTLIQIFVIQAPPPSPVDLTKRFDALDAAIVKVQADTAAAIVAARQDIAKDVTASVDGLQKTIVSAISDSEKAVIKAIPNANAPGSQAQTVAATKKTGP